MLVSIITLAATVNPWLFFLTFSFLSFFFFFAISVISSLSPSFCGVAVSSSPPSLSALQRYPFFFRMLQMRIPNRPITQKMGTKANTAYSADFSSALRTTVPLTGPPAPLDGPLPTVRTVLTCKDAEKKEERKKEGNREQDVRAETWSYLNKEQMMIVNWMMQQHAKLNTLFDTLCRIMLTFHTGTLGGNFPCGSGVKPANGKRKKRIEHN